MEWKELKEVLREKGVNSNRAQFFQDNLNVDLEKQAKK